MTEDASQRQLRRALVLTFPLAFAAHDLEEVLTAARWSEDAPSRIAMRHPALGRGLGRVLPVSTREMALAVGVAPRASAR